MEPKNRQHRTVALRARSRSPDYFVDLTVDSPLLRDSRTSVRRQNLARANSNHGAETSQNENSELPDLELIDCTNRLLPPKKRSRLDPGRTTTVIHLDDSMPSNETPVTNENPSGESNLPTCPVCLELLTSKRKPTSTRCGHVYCAECIEQTFKMSKKCPKCQSTITQRSCIRLYF